jgi:hypothetical protein
MKRQRELPIPPLAQADSNSVELARVWAAGGRQHVSLATGLWSDPAEWGIMLTDLARHIAKAYEELEGRNNAETLKRIRDGLEAEWDLPTDTAIGGLLN